MSTRECKVCKETKPLASFETSAGAHRWQCVDCRLAAAKVYRAARRAAERAVTPVRHSTNPWENLGSDRRPDWSNL